MSGIQTTNTILDKIVAEKIKEVEEIKSRPRKGGDPARRGKGNKRDFIGALKDRKKPGRAIIAEVKKASPSAGVLRDPFQPEAIARA